MPIVAETVQIKHQYFCRLRYAGLENVKCFRDFYGENKGNRRTKRAFCNHINNSPHRKSNDTAKYLYVDLVYVALK